jgi:hypothetical protein
VRTERLEPVRIYSSMRGLLAAGIAPGLLVALVIVGLNAQPRFSPIMIVISILALVLGGAALLDLPRHTVFGPDGVTRVCALRRHTLRWDDIVVLRRARGSLIANLRSRDPEHTGVGPLIAKVGRRNYLLCNQSESRPEYDRIVAGMAVWAPELVMGAARPPVKVPPSDLYRRRKSSPQTGRR